MEYISYRGSRRVDGRRKWTLVRTFFLRSWFFPFNAALEASFAFDIVGPGLILTMYKIQFPSWSPLFFVAEHKVTYM